MYITKTNSSEKPGGKIFPVSKNARFTHNMANFGLFVHGKRFSTHEAETTTWPKYNNPP